MQSATNTAQAETWEQRQEREGRERLERLSWFNDKMESLREPGRPRRQGDPRDPRRLPETGPDRPLRDLPQGQGRPVLRWDAEPTGRDHGRERQV